MARPDRVNGTRTHEMDGPGLALKVTGRVHQVAAACPPYGREWLAIHPVLNAKAPKFKRKEPTPATPEELVKRLDCAQTSSAKRQSVPGLADRQAKSNALVIPTLSQLRADTCGSGMDTTAHYAGPDLPFRDCGRQDGQA